MDYSSGTVCEYLNERVMDLIRFRSISSGRTRGILSRSVGRRAYGNVIRNAYAASRILLWVVTLVAVFRLARFVEVVESDRSAFLSGHLFIDTCPSVRRVRGQITV